MGGKKPDKSFRNTPFRQLSGVSVARPEASPLKAKPSVPAANDAAESDFYTQMSRLGVKPLDPSRPPGSAEQANRPAERPVPETSSEEEVFLRALGALEVRFKDELPVPTQATRSSRRMKQLRQGRLPIEASLDLHGLTRSEALVKVGHFLDNAWFHQLRTLLIVTGKGTHSADGPVLRTSLEEYLQSRSHPAVVEWGRAPHEYGGKGALVVFLRRSDS